MVFGDQHSRQSLNPSMKRFYSPALHIGLGAVGARVVGRQIASHLGTVSQLADLVDAEDTVEIRCVTRYSSGGNIPFSCGR